jgi:hypothetical protein
MDGAIHHRPAATKQGRDLAEALPLLKVQPHGLGALVRAQRVLPAGVDTALLRIHHPGLDAFTDQLALEPKLTA